MYIKSCSWYWKHVIEIKFVSRRFLSKFFVFLVSYQFQFVIWYQSYSRSSTGAKSLDLLLSMASLFPAKVRSRSPFDFHTTQTRTMKIALLPKNKIRFIDDTCLKEKQETALQPQWERCNAIVLSWILNSVSKKLFTGIVYSSNAQSVWHDLKERYGKVNGSRIFKLRRGINGFVQGSLSVSIHFTKLKKLWDEYAS